MKKMISVIALMLSLSAMAQVKVDLNSDKVSVDAADAILVRTATTPKKVKVTFKVPMYDSVCQSYATRPVLRTSGALCGYQTGTRAYDRVVCDAYNPYNHQCIRSHVERRIETVSIPRTCTVPEQYCSSYGTATSFENDTVTIKFKNLPALGGTEQDTFLVKAKQKRYDGTNVVYEVTPQQTVQEYVVKDRGFSLFNYSKFVIKPKN
jgi:hypothetical protein